MQYVAATPASPAMQYVQTSSYAEDPYSAQPYGYTTTAGYGYAPGKLLDLCSAGLRMLRPLILHGRASAGLRI